MILRKLNGAIRAHEGAPRIYVNVGGIVPLHVGVQKTSLLDELAKAFPDGGETGLWLSSQGWLMKEGSE